jgi:arabinogalactan endo-1,4-beta-galactosidase
MRYRLLLKELSMARDRAARFCAIARIAAMAATLLALVSPAAAATMDDPFGANSLDWCRWEDVSWFGAATQAGELALTPSGSQSYTAARVLSQARLLGDFDIQVDYRLGAGFNAPLSGASGPGFYTTLALAWDDSRTVNFSRTHNTFVGDGAYVYSPLPGFEWTNAYFAASNAQEGTLRMVRAGTNLSFFHRALNSATWVPVGSMSVPATPVNVMLSASNSGTTTGFTSYFRNFKLSAGQTDDVDYALPATFLKRPDFALGGVSENWPAMKYFDSRFTTFDPFSTFKAQGMEWIRVGVTTSSVPLLDAISPEQWRNQPGLINLAWWGSREYAAVTLRDAQSRGMRLDAYLYMSDTAANWGNQSAPAAWAGKSIADTAVLVEQQAFDTATYFKNKGLNIEIYEIGNEIDIGIIDFLPGRRITVPPGVDFVNNRQWLRDNVWNIEAQLLSAAIAGIRRANPSARVAIHAASLEVGTGSRFGPDFFQAMRDFGVNYDIAAISHPYALDNYSWKLSNYSATCWFKRVDRVVREIAAPGKPVMIVEASYPSNPATLMSNAMPDFPFTPQGQADWLHAQLRFASNHPSMAGWFYFYPEFFEGWRPPGDPAYALGLASLLASETVPRPALSEFRANLSATVSSECLFNWAERSYPQYFSPEGVSSAILEPYLYRYYPSTGNYVATSSADDHVWVLGPSFGGLLDVGPKAQFLGLAGCSP